MKKFLEKLKNKQDLSFDESKAAFEILMEGKASEDEIFDFLTLLSAKGEVSDEVAGGVYVLREKSKRVNVQDCVDTCGTGGDGMNTLNISTASALLLASMNIKVAKHGNKAVSSKCGSGDVLEALNININLETGQLDLEGKVVSLKSKVSITPDDISLGFAGALNFDAEPSLQGQLQFESTAKAPYITKPVKGQGLLTADKNAIKFTDMEIASAGDISVSGDASYEITASKFAANLKSGKSVNAKALLGNAFPFETISFDISASGDLTKISIKDSKIILDKSQLLVSADYLLPVNGLAWLN